MTVASSMVSITSIILAVDEEPEPIDIATFPQADSINKVLTVSEIIYSNPGLTYDDISMKLSVVKRQGQYYGMACVYLGLATIEKNGSNLLYPTDKCKDYMSSSPDQKNIIIIKQMAKHKVLRHFIYEGLERNQEPTKNEITEFLKNNSAYKLNETTAKRRSQTILSWIRWVLNDAVVDG